MMKVKMIVMILLVLLVFDVKAQSKEYQEGQETRYDMIIDSKLGNLGMEVSDINEIRFSEHGQETFIEIQNAIAGYSSGQGGGKKYILISNSELHPGDYKSLLEAMYENGENCCFCVYPGTYNVVEEYKSFFGEYYFNNWNYPSGTKFDNGLYLKHGCQLIGLGEVNIVFPAIEVSELCDDKFSPLNTTVNNLVFNINITSNGNGKYLLHDDFAGDATGNYWGVNVFKNIVFNGKSSKSTTVGSGCGMYNSYIWEDCIFNEENDVNIAYHNGFNPGKNKIYIRNCYGKGNVRATHYGYSTEKTLMYVTNSKFNNYHYTDASTGSMNHNNMEIVEWNNVWTGM